MVYFLNTNINQSKKTSVALCKVYGIGKTLSLKICNQLGLNENVKINQLNDAQIEKISQLISENFIFGTELKQKLHKQKIRLVRISSYRGFRHKQGLPCRGQRTHTNANSARKFVLKKNY